MQDAVQRCTPADAVSNTSKGLILTLSQQSIVKHEKPPRVAPSNPNMPRVFGGISLC